MEKTLHRLADLLLDVVFLVKEDGEIAFVNEACIPILGYEPTDMIGRNIRDFIHPEDLSPTKTEMSQVINGRPGFGFENRYLRKDGSEVSLQWAARWSPEDGLRIGVARDITERVRAEVRQATMLALSMAAHEAHSPNTMFAAFNGALQTMFRLQNFAAFLESDERLVYIADEAYLSTSTDWCVIPIATPGKILGQLRLHFADSSSLLAPELEVLLFAASQAAAAIERFTLQSELARAAYYDELTGLPNRRLFLERMKSAITRARRTLSGGALLFIDLDDFKRVNDEHGHGTGDKLLYEVGRRISACIREIDSVARLGGDEFVALLEGVASADQAQVIADKIRNAISQSMVLDGTELNASASIGIVLYPQLGEDIDQLMRHADRAMYASKVRRKP